MDFLKLFKLLKLLKMNREGLMQSKKRQESETSEINLSSLSTLSTPGGMMTNFEVCPRFEGCGAPLCTIEESSLKNGIWYPSEEVCRNQKVNQLDWIRRQRKLARRAHPEFYFTYEILKHNFVIRTGIKGLDPDKPEAQESSELKKWLSAHPEAKKRELTPEYLERLKRGRNFKKGRLYQENAKKKYAHDEGFVR